jgi:hypothetical protein
LVGVGVSVGEGEGDKDGDTDGVIDTVGVAVGSVDLYMFIVSCANTAPVNNRKVKSESMTILFIFITSCQT